MLKVAFSPGIQLVLSSDIVTLEIIDDDVVNVTGAVEIKGPLSAEYRNVIFWRENC